MAYRRKTIISNPIDRNTGEYRNLNIPTKTKPIGVVLPFDNPNGVFRQSFISRDQIFSNLKNLLLTAKGERYFLPEFGTNIRGVLFENIVDEDTFTSRLQGEVETAIRTWMPFLVISELRVELNLTEDGRPDDPNHAVGIFLRVIVSGTNIYLPIRIFISETATIRLTEEAQN